MKTIQVLDNERYDIFLKHHEFFCCLEYRTYYCRRIVIRKDKSVHKETIPITEREYNSIWMYEDLKVLPGNEEASKEYIIKYIMHRFEVLRPTDTDDDDEAYEISIM